MPSDDHYPQPELPSAESVAAAHPRGDKTDLRARHRAPGPPLEHLAGLWGIAPARHIDVSPGEEPVPLVRVPVPGPGPSGDPDGVFAGLTPPLAALLLLSYTRPGDVVLDATSDKAVEGTARAGGRDYRLSDLAAPVDSSAESRAHLVLAPWPNEDSAASTSPVSGQVQLLVEYRALLGSRGYVLLVAAELGEVDPSILATQIAIAALASELGQLRHVVEILRPLDDHEPGRTAAPNRTRSGLVAVVCAAARGRHA